MVQAEAEAATEIEGEAADEETEVETQNRRPSMQGTLLSTRRPRNVFLGTRVSVRTITNVRTAKPTAATRNLAMAPFVATATGLASANVSNAPQP